MQVLEQCVTQHRVISRVLDDGGDAVEPGDLRRTQTALAHDQLVLRLADSRARARPDDDGLQNAELAHGDDEFVELLLAELGARLLRVGNDVIGGELRQARAGDGDQALFGHFDVAGEEDIDRPVARVGARRDESADSASQSRALGCCHQFVSPA